ncbi:PAS domain-containing protein [Halovenus rubra]|uniref:PAS domain-containing protein n=2 Tax=Halovenus rubra TaxID=869890 RepID=A0ACC7E3Z8_9EURY|nr:PAS domain-containing protein [Halovenus rubra]
MSGTVDTQIQILHVDDESEVTELTETFLTEEDARFTMTTATSAEEGLSVLDDCSPDCIISDYNMPGMDGIEFLQAVRSTQPNLPFILYTGKGNEAVASEAISAGATDYLQKQSGGEQYRLLANRVLNAVSQYRSKARLRTTRDEYTAVFESAQSGLLLVDVDDNGFCYRQCNPRAVELIGKDRENVIGATPQEVLGPVDGAKVTGAYRKCIDTGEAVKYTVTLTQSGKRVIRDCKVAPVSSTGQVEELVVTLQDITDQRRHERELERYRTVFNELPDPVAVCDADGQYALVNDAFTQIRDQSREELNGKSSPYLTEVREEKPDAFDALRDGSLATLRSEVTADFSGWGTRTLECRLSRVTADDDDSIVIVTRDITSQKQREQDFWTKKHQYETLAENFPDGAVYLIDEEMVCLRARGEELSEVGFTPEDIEGHTPHELFPDDIASELCDYYDAAFAGTSHTFRQEYNGECYRIQTVPVRSGKHIEQVMAVSQNITDDIQDRRRLRQRDEQLTQLHDVTRELLAAGNPEEVAAAASESANSILDLPLNGIYFYDDSVDGLVPVTLSSASRELWDEMPVVDEGIAWEAFKANENRFYDDLREESNLFNPETEVRSEMCLPLGDHGIFILSSPESDSFDQPTVELAQTLAANTKAALDRISQEQELRNRKEALVRKNERLDEFANIISHDLRSPLTVAEGHIELAQDNHDDPHLAQATEGINRSKALIDDLLTLAQNGETVGEIRHIELATLVRHSWQTVDTGDTTLTVDVTSTIQADRSRLQQLFENLYRNAIEHAGEDVAVHVGETEGGFYVADTGAGIPATDRAQIFEAGYSASGTGTGLGLRIVKQIIEAHGWEIAVTESEAGGTQFTITGVSFVES